MTLEGLAGLASAFDPRIQQVRPHPGQQLCAENIRKLTKGSGMLSPNTSKKTQDCYSLRCMLHQVHGASRDVLAYARAVFEREINSATDNPLVFAAEDEIISGGNFHGQPLALALDFVAIAVAELANISERRIEQLVQTPTYQGLRAVLRAREETAIHSGYMIAQVTAASLVNENKVLCTPASVDSIPGSASREDHVSMGMTSARKLREIVANTRVVLAVETMCAGQAMDFRAPAKAGAGTAAAHEVMRSVIAHLDVDRYLAKDLEAVLALEQRGDLLKAAADAVSGLN